jgi:hypothetical protein
VLVGVYGLFALAAGARAGVQIATKFDDAPVAYLLSALAAVIYLVATFGLAKGGPGGRRTALICLVRLRQRVRLRPAGSARPRPALVAPQPLARFSTTATPRSTSRRGTRTLAA